MNGSARRTRSLLLVIALLALAGIVTWAMVTWWPKRGGLELWTVIDEAGGLEEGKAITMAGVEVGWIESTALTDDDRVRVVFRIDRAHVQRMFAPIDEGACRADENACGTRVGHRATASLAPLTPQSFVVYPAHARGRALRTGDFVPSVNPPGTDP